MTNKSHVSLEQKQCPVCGITHDTGSLLLDTRLRETFDRETVTGLELCPIHKQLHEQGFIALVEVDNTINSQNTLKIGDAKYTGNYAHVRRPLLKDICPSLSNHVIKLPMMYVQKGFIDRLKEIQDEIKSMPPPPARHPLEQTDEQ